MQARGERGSQAERWLAFWTTRHIRRDWRCPLGGSPTVGIGGLATGGGIGRMSRRFGLTLDSIRSVDVVTADGKLVHASEIENPELFWAVRGGGGNFWGGDSV